MENKEKSCLGNYLTKGKYGLNVCKGYVEKCCEYHKECSKEFMKEAKNGSDKSTITK